MRRLLVAAAAVIAFGTFGAFGGVAQAAPPLKPTFSKAAAFDVSKPLREMTAIDRTGFESVTMMRRKGRRPQWATRLIQQTARCKALR